MKIITKYSFVFNSNLDDRQWVESQKRSFRTFVFQSTRYLSSSTGNSINGLIFEDENEESTKSQSSLSSSTKQIVLIEVSSCIYLFVLKKKRQENKFCLSNVSSLSF